MINVAPALLVIMLLRLLTTDLDIQLRIFDRQVKPVILS